MSLGATHHALVHELLDKLAALPLAASLAAEVERHDETWPDCPRRWPVAADPPAISFEPVGSLGSTNLQAAVEELGRSVADASGLLDGLRLGIDTTPLVSTGGTVTTSHSIDLSPAHWPSFLDDAATGSDVYGPSVWSGVAPAPRSSTLLPGGSYPSAGGGMIYYGPDPPVGAVGGDVWIPSPESVDDVIGTATVYDGVGWVALTPAEPRPWTTPEPW